MPKVDLPQMTTRVLFISNKHIDDPDPNVVLKDLENVTHSTKSSSELNVNLMDNYDLVVMGYIMDPEGVIGNWLADYVDQGGRLLLTYLNFRKSHMPRGRFESENYSPFRVSDGLVQNRWVVRADSDHSIMKGVKEMHSKKFVEVKRGKGMHEVLASDYGGRPAVGIRTDKLGLVIGLTGSLSGNGDPSGNITTMVDNIRNYSARFGLNAMFDKFNSVYENQQYLDMLNIFEPLEVLFDIEYSGLIRRKQAYERPIAKEARALKKDKKSYDQNLEELDEYIDMLRHGAELLKKLEEAGLLKDGTLDEEGLRKLKEILMSTEGDLAEKLKNNKFVKSLPEPLQKLLAQKRALLDKEEGLIKMRNDSYDELMVIKRRLKEMGDEMDDIRGHMASLRKDWEKTFKTWGVSEVGGWVRTMHHEFRNDIWRCFTSNDIEGSDLKDLDEEEIFGFGVEKFRHRAILLENIEKLPTEEMLKMFEAEQSARDALAARRLSENQKFDEEFGALCALMDENYDNVIQVEEFQKTYPVAAQVFKSFSIDSTGGEVSKEELRRLFEMPDGSGGYDLNKLLQFKSGLQSNMKRQPLYGYGYGFADNQQDEMKEEEVKVKPSSEFEVEFLVLCDVVDSNHDKSISLDEFAKVYPIATEHFYKMLDINKDSILSKEEFRAMFILADGSGDLERVREMTDSLQQEMEKDQTNDTGGTQLPHPT